MFIFYSLSIKVHRHSLAEDWAVVITLIPNPVYPVREDHSDLQSGGMAAVTHLSSVEGRTAGHGDIATGHNKKLCPGKVCLFLDRIQRFTK